GRLKTHPLPLHLLLGRQPAPMRIPHDDVVPQRSRTVTAPGLHEFNLSNALNVALGVPQVGGDRIRAFGRASQGAAPTIKDLCGHCAHEKCAIGPTGDMWPCVLGRFLSMGNVKTTPVAEVWNGAQAARVTADIAAVHGNGVQSCTPPQFLPMCGPCVPSVGHCDPREATVEAPAIGAPA
ncbi:hypothetical protein GTY54_04295, partial [Streptomyces sp. SID625]|nr:hypothetical protein [Streptomyces sp. SID625]